MRSFALPQRNRELVASVDKPDPGQAPSNGDRCAQTYPVDRQNAPAKFPLPEREDNQ